MRIERDVVNKGDCFRGANTVRDVERKRERERIRMVKEIDKRERESENVSEEDTERRKE